MIWELEALTIQKEIANSYLRRSNVDKLKLKNLYKLRKEILVLDNQIDSLNREYAQMNSKSLVGSPVITGLPNGKGDTSDKTGNHAISNVYIETQINILVAERLKIRCKVIEYTHALELSGASVDSLQTSMRTLSSVMTQADDESKDSSQYLTQLGVSVEDAEGNMRSTEEVEE